MPRDPLVSFIVLSYQYERYIRRTLESILAQTVQDFEIVVVDDASRDASVEVIRSFDDARIHLHVNDVNEGGAAAYNRALGLARGRFLVNLDADDWIDARKTEVQLAAFERDPTLDVLGTWLRFVDERGERHARSEELEATANRAHDFNLVDTWIVQNCLYRSTTMVRRAAHERVGVDDAAMVRAPDYELWTRFLRTGCRFGLVQEPLTYMRVHSRGVTFGDPRGQFRELAYGLLVNVLPVVEARSAYTSLGAIVSWLVAHEQFALLTPAERHRLLGFFLTSPRFDDYRHFERALSAGADQDVEVAGRRALALALTGTAQIALEKLERDVALYIQARDYHHRESESWEREAARWRRKAEWLDPRGVVRKVKRLWTGRRAST